MTMAGEGGVPDLYHIYIHIYIYIQMYIIMVISM